MGYISKGKGAIGRHGFKSLIGVYNKGSSAIPPANAVFRAGGMGLGKDDQLNAQWNIEGGTTTGILSQNAGALLHIFSVSSNGLDAANPTISIGGFGCLRTANYPSTVVDPLEVGVFEIASDDPNRAVIDAVGAGVPVNLVSGSAVAANAGEIGHELPLQSITLAYADIIGGGATPSIAITYTGGSLATQIQRTFTITFVA